MRNTDDVVNLRSDPVIFGSGSTVDPPSVNRPPPVGTPDDLDGDGLANADDYCPTFWVVVGGDSFRRPGCQSVEMTASASYAAGHVTGFIQAPLFDPEPWRRPSDPTAYYALCTMPTTVTVWEYEDLDDDPFTRPVRTRKLG